MSLWQEITKTALLGTQREDVSISSGSSSPLDQLVDKTEAESAEMSLLLKAAVMTAHEQNGRLPEQLHSPRPTPPNPDSRPVAPPKTMRYLSDVMYGQYIILLPTYLDYLNKAGYRLPAQYLPNLLDKGVKATKIRPYLYPILGNEGHWLASQNPVWDYAAPDIYTWGGLIRYWEQNEPLKRQQLLTSLRQKNPEFARKLLENYWRSVPDMMRHQLIKIVETNISMADEPFLEAALDDRNHLVRRKAAELLAFLPDSRLALRMANHVRHILQWKQGKIVVTFPKEISPQMGRDGIQQTDPNQDMSRLRSRQLTQMVSATPLDYWTLEWKASIPEIIRAIPHCRWPRTLLNALTTAARKQKNQTWIKALVTQKSFGTQVARLLRVMDHDTLYAYIQENKSLFSTDKKLLKIDHPMMAVLKNHPHSWDETMSRFWIEQFATYIKQTKDRKSIDVQVKMVLTRLFNDIPVSLLQFSKDTFQPAIELNDKWRSPIQQVLRSMAFRKRMIDDVLGTVEIE